MSGLDFHARAGMLISVLVDLIRKELAGGKTSAGKKQGSDHGLLGRARRPLASLSGEKPVGDGRVPRDQSSGVAGWNRRKSRLRRESRRHRSSTSPQGRARARFGARRGLDDAGTHSAAAERERLAGSPASLISTRL